jgi:hypothetical protein
VAMARVLGEILLSELHRGSKFLPSIWPAPREKLGENFAKQSLIWAPKWNFPTAVMSFSPFGHFK